MKNGFLKKTVTIALAASILGVQLTGCGANANNTTTALNDCCTMDTSTDSSGSAQAGVTANSVITATDYTTYSEEELEALYEKEPASQRKIVIPYDSGACVSPIPIAKYKGFFEANGIDVEFVSSADARDALVAGKVDAAVGMLTDWMTAIQNGIDLKFTMALHTGCTSAAVLADSDIDSFEAGQKVGISGAIGSYTHNIALRFVSHDGFVADDFNWLALDSSTVLAALQQGDVDVIIAGDQLLLQWEKEGLVKIIRSQTTDDDFKNEACCAFGFTKEFIEENPVTVYKITKSLYESCLWLSESEENRKEAVDYLLENGYTSGTEEYNLILLNSLQFGVPFENLEKSLDDIVGEFVNLGILDKNLDQEKFKEGLLVDYNIDNLNK